MSKYGFLDEQGRARKRLREVCVRCGRTFGEHGAVPPHTIGDDCAGFRAAKEQHP